MHKDFCSNDQSTDPYEYMLRYSCSLNSGSSLAYNYTCNEICNTSIGHMTIAPAPLSGHVSSTLEATVP